MSGTAQGTVPGLSELRALDTAPGDAQGGIVQGQGSGWMVPVSPFQLGVFCDVSGGFIPSSGSPPESLLLPGRLG